MKVLILSRSNAARGPIAEGLARQMFGDVTFVSASSEPRPVSKVAVAVMREVDVDISQHAPRALHDVDVGEFDLALTINERDLSGGLPAKVKRVHWPLPDPLDPPADEREILARMRDTRIAIAKHLKGLEMVFKRVKKPGLNR